MILTDDNIAVGPYKKLVSLVPSITELLHHLHLEQEVVGITKFCIHPSSWRRTKEVVGGTKNIHIQKIASLVPDLVIASKEENVKAQIEEVAGFTTVLLTDVNSFEDALNMIATIGNFTSRSAEAKRLISEIRTGFSELNNSPAQPLKAAYLIWQSPYMAVGANTYINDMLRICGFQNIFASSNRYPVVETAQLQDADVVLLSTEPYPFKEGHVAKLSAILNGKKCMLVDGEMFSWYGSRMLKAATYFASLHNELMM